ncbi:unnamed protein product, partial [Pylaiella littoralis]
MWLFFVLWLLFDLYVQCCLCGTPGAGSNYFGAQVCCCCWFSRYIAYRQAKPSPMVAKQIQHGARRQPKNELYRKAGTGRAGALLHRSERGGLSPVVAKKHQAYTEALQESVCVLV